MAAAERPGAGGAGNNAGGAGQRGGSFVRSGGKARGGSTAGAFGKRGGGNRRKSKRMKRQEWGGQLNPMVAGISVPRGNGETVRVRAGSSMADFARRI